MPTHLTSIELQLPEIGTVELSYSLQGTGHPFLLLHGGGGSATVTAFAELLAAERNARIITPVHPGFGGTSRAASLTSIRQLALLYIALLDSLDLCDVTVVGSSIGGWIAAEIALLSSSRISSVVLLDAVGIEVKGHPVADFFSLSFPQLAQLSYFDPAEFLIDPSTMGPEQLIVMASNRAALQVYSGTPSMVDPSLLARLSNVTAPTLVVWGDSDGIVDPEYGSTYAAAIPGAEFVKLAKTGHMPQLESPVQLIGPLWNFAAQHATGGPVAERSLPQ